MNRLKKLTEDITVDGDSQPKPQLEISLICSLTELLVNINSTGPSLPNISNHMQNNKNYNPNDTDAWDTKGPHHLQEFDNTSKPQEEIPYK